MVTVGSGVALPRGTTLSPSTFMYLVERYLIGVNGTVDGIIVKWGPNAITNLPNDAKVFKVDQTALKGATEHVAHASAKRLGKTGVRILYAVIPVLISIVSPVP
ncbi:hypothetical protein AJ80_04590 [Polytolypa hystricis UAMH7299]|uniref:Uncharacterized protein n=1 Tax=Polytolypa hystricis (strain UAMH7299) TaxID=1447883 RepID=A0A2B7YA44_POLH7|nr:hypothetical protein AJ80_04590 [Polytolypa hystricis UAMH7299]